MRKRAFAATSAVLLTAALSSCAAESDAAPTGGELLAFEPLVSMDAAGLAEHLVQQGFAPADVRYGVDAFRYLYRTTDFAGEPTVASGVAAFPRTDEELPLTVYLHGTNPSRGTAASIVNSPDRAAVLLFAGTGQAATAPDYAGLGLGLGEPEYMLAAPTVQTSLDSMRATRAIAEQRGAELDGGVNVAGFSQGGHASVPLGKAIQDDPEYELRAVGAVAGPHDIAGTELPAALDGRVDPRSAVVYLGYFVTSWNHAYHLYDSPSEAFRAPYDQTAEALFDGTHSFPEILQGLPSTPQELLQPEMLQKLSHPTGELAEAFAGPVRWKKLARSHGRETYVRVRDSLIELGVIRVGSRQVLGVVPVERVTAVDPASVGALQEHVASIVRSTVPVHEIVREDAALVGLTDAGNLLPKSIAVGELRKHRSRVGALAALGGPAVLAASAAVEHKRRVRLAAGHSG